MMSQSKLCKLNFDDASQIHLEFRKFTEALEAMQIAQQAERDKFKKGTTVSVVGNTKAAEQIAKSLATWKAMAWLNYPC